MLSLWRIHKTTDLVVGAAVAVVGAQLIALGSEPATFYQLVGGTAVGVLAFVVTPISIVLTLRGGVRSDALDRHHRGTLIAAMAWAFGLSVATILATVLVAGIVDNQHLHSNAQWGVLGLFVAMIASTVRLFWFFLVVLRVRRADDNRPLEVTLTER